MKFWTQFLNKTDIFLAGFILKGVEFKISQDKK